MRLGLPIIVCLISLMGVREAAAAVMLSEVAWMGSLVSPNHEWIELYNNGDSAVNLSGWTLVDGNNFNIALTGSIAGGAYAVLERTSEDSAPGSALLLYTGALVNTGATLTLRRGDGQIEDQVVGGEGWQRIGGDNVTKATAQYSGSDWITAEATPGEANATTEEESNPPPTSIGDTRGTSAAKTSSGRQVTTPSVRTSTIPLTPAKTVLALALEAQRVAFVDQTIRFTAVPSGIGDTIMNSLKYRWNFGDFATASGSTVRHAYRFPGTYIVTVRAEFGRHNTVARHEVTVLPVTLSLGRGPEGEVQIQNDAVYDVDVSGYVLELSGERKVFPPDSYLMAKQTVTFPPLQESTQIATVTLRNAAGNVVARDGGGTIVAAAVIETSPVLAPRSSVGRASVIATTPSASQLVLPPTTEAATQSLFSFVVPTTAAMQPVPTNSAGVMSISPASLASATVTTSNQTMTTPWPYMLLGLVLTLALSAVYYARRHDAVT